MTLDDVQLKYRIPVHLGVEEGWADLLDGLFTDLVPLQFDLAWLTWVQEEHGLLRIDYSVIFADDAFSQDARADHYDEWQDRLLQAEEASLATCQRCGAPGRLSYHGRWATLCHAHECEEVLPHA